ncbi:MAG: CocE/NonD family hydrolase [Actinobacteria bacterium]|uniref:Unannotated protein n=1 Tax=freshwater metagenome TaxID=449393 RepID=A0A6J5Z479_9ZZZZ|nr:CocE/NonD family hydrolase [Actinomycetota bacterium]
MLKVRTLAIGSIAAVAVAAFAAVPAGAAGLSANGSIGQAYVLGAQPDQKVSLLNARGKAIQSGTTDRFGSYIFLDVSAGSNYRVRAGSTLTPKFKVLSTKSNPAASFFKKKKLKAGLNYVKVRDGIEIAMTVRLPSGKKSLDEGPFPTIVEYSGYQTAAPHKFPLAGSDPLAPASSTAVGALISPLLGFAVVSVQMRGSGCSGGAFDLFGLPTTYDGYDAIETVAAQSWVKGHKVGMAGISFSGITQLFTAGTQPPHLAAIAPMSVTDDTYTATGYPGGINNSGFALSWVRERMSDAEPAPEGGQPWAKALVNAGDVNCIANQKLRLQTRDAIKVIDENPYRTPGEFDQRSPGAWVSKIKVPTFLIGQYQDEQTGGHFVESLAALKKNPNVWLSLQNGVHCDSLGPSTLTRWVEFLNLFVADRIPKISNSVISLSSGLYAVLANAPAAPVLQSRFAEMTNVKAAKAIFKRDPRVRLMMDNGAGPEGLGSIGATWDLGYDSWPIRQVKAKTYYFGPDGTMTSAKPGSATTASYLSDPSARPLQTLYGEGAGDDWKAQPRYDWTPLASGKGIGFTTAALGSDIVIAGTSSIDLFLKSSARDTDLQVTLSEVRPDGKETYIQNGWLRASHRKLDAKKSTALDPFPTHLKKDAAFLPAGVFTSVRVPLFPVAHAFRAGSKIRVTLEAAGGDRAIWKFATIDDGTATNTISLGGAQPSKILLPVIAGATAKGTPRPAPTALRGQPSREYTAASNGG